MEILKIMVGESRILFQSVNIDSV